MAYIHTLKIDHADGVSSTVLTRKSESRQYVAVVVVTVTPEACEARLAVLRSKLAQAEAKLAELTAGSDRTPEQWKAASDAAEKDHRERLDALDQTDDGKAGYATPEHKRHWERVTAEIQRHHETLEMRVHFATWSARNVRGQIEHVPPMGSIHANSWHLSMAQARKTVADRVSSMFHIHDLDKLEIRTDFEVRETAKRGKKAAG